MLGLASLKDSELDRTIRYAKYFKQINDKWHFIENMTLYKKEKEIKKKTSDYDKEWRERVEREHPDWSDKEFMTTWNTLQM